MEAGWRGAELDYFDDDNLFNQVIGWVECEWDSCMTATLQTQQGILPAQAASSSWSLQRSLCRGFLILHKELNRGCKENNGSSDALSSFKPRSILVNSRNHLLYPVVLKKILETVVILYFLFLLIAALWRNVCIKWIVDQNVGIVHRLRFHAILC